MRDVNFRGLTFGKPDSVIRITGVQGLNDYDSNAGTESPDWLHGGWPTGGWMPSREVILDLRVNGKYGNTTAALQALKRSFAPSPGGIREFPFTFVNDNGESYVMYARCTGRSFGLGPDRRHYVDGSVRLLAADPRLYSATELQTSIGVWVDEGGTTWAGLAWPFTWQPGASAETAAYNNGTFNTWPRFEIVGPSAGTLVNPRIENLADGTFIDLSADGGLSIQAGQTLEIETRPHLRNVTLEGVQRWNNLAHGSEFTPLEPGDTSFRLRANGDVTGAELIIYWRHAEL